MAKLIGVPDEDVAEFSRWSQGLSPVFGFMTPAQIAAAEAAVEALLAYARSVLERRREDPQDDLITRLLHTEDDGERLTDDEVADMVVNLVVSSAAARPGTRAAFAERLAAEGDRPSDELRGLVSHRPGLLLSYASSAAILAILVLMVWKPGS